MAGPAARALRGAARGVLATIPMSVVMLLRDRRGDLGKHPPERIVERGLDAAGVPRTEREENALASAAHLAYGGVLGAGYAALRPLLPAAAPDLLLGPAYGAAVYLAHYAGALPALGIEPPPDEDRGDRQRSMAAAHVVFGLALGALAARSRALQDDVGQGADVASPLARAAGVGG